MYYFFTQICRRPGILVTLLLLFQLTVSGQHSQSVAEATANDSSIAANLKTASGKDTGIVTTVAICPLQLPFVWNNKACTAAGTYYVHLKNIAGALDSVAVLVLEVKVATSSVTSRYVCSSDLPYSWNGTSITAAGTYTVKLINAVGCDSVALLILKVKQTNSSTTVKSVCTSQMPYLWNGITCTAAGPYHVTLVNVNGCDSLATLVLNVNTSSASVRDTTVCSNQLPLTWNGKTISAAGSYQQTLVNSVGCDSVATLEVTVHAVTTSSTIKNICTGQLPFMWSGKTFTGAGTYTVKLVNLSGCDSIATLVLKVNATTSSTTSKTICVNQLPYTWNGKSCAAAGTYLVTLVNTAGCDSIATLILTVQTTLTSIANMAVCSSQMPLLWNGNTYNAAGTYTVTLKSFAGCDSVVSLALSVKPANASTTNKTLCSSQLPFLWNGNNYNAAGNYTIKLVNAAGCDSLAMLALTVNFVSSSVTNKAICFNQVPYSWNGKVYNASGKYSVNLLNSVGCDSVATLVLTVGPATTGLTAVTICNTSLPYLWNGKNYTAAGNYTVTLVNTAGCDSIAQLSLAVQSATGSTTYKTICVGELPYTWNGNIYSVPGTYSVKLASYTGCDSLATLVLKSTTVLNTSVGKTVCADQLPFLWKGISCVAAGTYAVTYKSVGGCDSVVTLTLAVNAVSNSMTTKNICSGQLPFVWNGITCNSGGTYNVTLLNSTGCDSVASLVLNVGTVTTSNTNTIICSGQSPFIWNGNSYNSSGTYTAKLVNAAGCDSIATLVLKVHIADSSVTNKILCSGQLPFSWNGNNYNTAGTYQVVLVNASGCDSIARLVLTVNAAVSSITKMTICPAQLPYTWNGTAYTAAGSYNVTLQSSAGCDSVATLVLSVSSIATDIYQTVCPGHLPFVWNGNSYYTAGNFTIKYKNVFGCDSLSTLHLTLGATSSSITSKNICSGQLPFVWNGTAYTTDGIYSANLVNFYGCDSVAILILSVKQSTVSTTSKTICSAALPFAWNGNVCTTAGVYHATLLNAAGCDSVATLNLFVNAVSSSTTNQTICSNQLPFVWNGKSYAATGSYQSVFINSVGCDSVATLNLKVQQITSSRTNKTICASQCPFNWNGNWYNNSGSYDVLLKNAAGCDSTATLVLTVKPVSASGKILATCDSIYTLPDGKKVTITGVYKSTLVNSVGCDSIITTAITFNTAPELIIHNPAAVCAAAATDITGEAITAGSAEGITLGYWKDAMAADTLSHPAFAAPGTYYIKAVSAAGCFVIKSVTVPLQPDPYLVAGADTVICTQSTALLHGAVFNVSNASPVFFWQPVAGINDADDAVTAASPLHTTRYTLTARLRQAGCDYVLSDSVLVKVQPPPRILATNDTNVVSGTLLQLHASGAVNYSWQPADLLDNSQSAEPRAILNKSTEFIVIGSDSYGCADKKTILVKVFKNKGYYLPSAFSPNGDGLNDLFRPIPIGISSTSFFRIMNRQGTVLFQTNKYMEGWDGTYKGVMQPPANYVWMLKGTDTDGKMIEMKGNVVLIR